MLFATVPIVLDTILQDRHIYEGGDKDIPLFFAIPATDIQPASSILLSNKFTYQYPVYPTINSDLMACKYWKLMPRAFVFTAGKMSLIMFDLSQNAEEFRVLNLESQRAHLADAYHLFDQLTPFLRPDLTFMEKPSDIKFGQDSRVAVICPIDCLLQLPLLVKPETRYQAFSKRSLVLFGLPMADSEIVNTVLGPTQIPKHEIVDFEVQHMMSRICAR